MSYPEEALWEPVFREWHLGWRMIIRHGWTRLVCAGFYRPQIVLFDLTRPLLLGEVPHPLLNPPLLRREGLNR